MLDPLEPLIRQVEEFASSVSQILGVGRPDIELGSRHAPIVLRFHRFSDRVSPGDLRVAVEKAGKGPMISGVSVVNYFVNVEPNYEELAKNLFRAVSELGEMYGVTSSCPGGRFVIEHTSANPIHPLHIGHGRNAVLGDTLARMLRRCGAQVVTRFYVNDSGAQVMYAALGYSEAGDLVEDRVRRGEKSDRVVGLVYAAVSAIAEISRLRREASGAGEERLAEVNREMDEWVGVLRRVMESDEELVKTLVERLGSREVDREAAEWNRRYEEGDPAAVPVVRRVVQLALDGQRTTLERLGITIDYWDFESEIAVWSGEARRLVSELEARAPGLVEREGGAVVFRADKLVAQSEEAMRLVSTYDVPGLSLSWLPAPRHIPPVTLTRSDGTTLYVTRDLAYAIWQHRDSPSAVVRVVASEQSHEQAHVRLMMWALGLRSEALRTVHYSYEVVNIPGVKMSSRRATYVPLDGILDEAEARIRRLFPESSSDVVSAVAVGAVRYFFNSVSPRKPMEFKWELVLDLSQNSGPFIQYSYVRAGSIMAKAGEKPRPAEVPATQMEREEKDLVFLLATWPRTFTEAVRTLRPDQVVEYVNRLAALFNRWYEKYPAIRAGEPVRSFRLALVESVRTVLGFAMDVLGIPRVERM